jgi:hypothetical protein
MRLSVRMNVDLPQPEGPINAVTVPAAKSSETFSSAWWLQTRHERRVLRVLNQVAQCQVRQTKRAAATPANEFGCDEVSVLICSLVSIYLVFTYSFPKSGYDKEG